MNLLVRMASFGSGSCWPHQEDVEVGKGRKIKNNHNGRLPCALSFRSGHLGNYNKPE